MMHTIHKYVQDELDKILKLQLLKSREIHSASVAKYRTFGRIHIELLPEEKTATVQSINKKYNNQIKEIYANINLKLSEFNLHKLNNPFI